MIKPQVLSIRDANGRFEKLVFRYSQIGENEFNQYTVTKYWPVRIKVLRNDVDNVVFILNKVVTDNYGNVSRVLLS